MADTYAQNQSTEGQAEAQAKAKEIEDFIRVKRSRRTGLYGWYVSFRKAVDPEWYDKKIREPEIKKERELKISAPDWKIIP